MRQTRIHTDKIQHAESSLWCKGKVDEDGEADCTWFGLYLPFMDALRTNRKASYVEWKSQKSLKDSNSMQWTK